MVFMDVRLVYFDVGPSMGFSLCYFLSTGSFSNQSCCYQMIQIWAPCTSSSISLKEFGSRDTHTSDY